ncbi:related to monophenol monooxygenase (tyrosinase) [Rhynchosporium secalis]|uniref:Related to monophenol monooxygenase (Tyrosinase) n=1 Tax=Rhynchosporium secalis TaxID=38038 RepID=A0A1E1MJB4_RHYSE|nr:related to monophenol monooxygenase (tyrosinase) [Rhynchosporium secalis]
MQIPHLLTAVSLLFSLATAAPPQPEPRLDAVDGLAAKGLINLEKYQKQVKSKCTVKNAVKRQEWNDLKSSDKKKYIAAVLCLQKKPSKSARGVAPGARSRYDDFVLVHVQQTMTIHATGNFLSWHRYFVWAYETALRDECGYKGYQPYWNWGRYASNPLLNPMVDGSDISLSGNGLKFNYTGVPLQGGPLPWDVIPPGAGGGCVTTGPFKNLEVRLGPLSATIPGVPVNPQADGLGYNPRCLRRDINPNAAAVTATNYTYDLITNPLHADIHWFQTVMQGQFEVHKWGVHTGGHYTIGGDPGGDFFTSPNDPIFFLHHGMIDRVWWIWQTQNLAVRLKAVSGTITFFNDPPSRNATLNDNVDLGLLAPPVKLGSLLDTMGGLNGAFCYIYV